MIDIATRADMQHCQKVRMCRKPYLCLQEHGCYVVAAFALHQHRGATAARGETLEPALQRARRRLKSTERVKQEVCV